MNLGQEIIETLRKIGLTQEQITLCLDVITDHRQLASNQGYQKGHLDGYEKGRAKGRAEALTEAKSAIYEWTR